MIALQQAITAFLMAFGFYSAQPATSPEAALYWASTPDIEHRVEHWDQLAWCESTGRWDLDTGTNFTGGIQFYPSSWTAVGGKGEPHNASRYEQQYRGELLLKIQGKWAWPGCTSAFDPLGHLEPLR